MKRSIITKLIATLLLVCSTIGVHASESTTNPRRRKQNKTEKRAEKDTLRQEVRDGHVVTILSPRATINVIAGDSCEISIEATEGAPQRRQATNSPQQIDSALAIWKASSTQRYYEDYFNTYLSFTKRQTAESKTSNLDSIYIARLEALMSPIPLKYNYEVRDAIEKFTSKYYATVMSYAYYYFPMIEEELIRAGLPIELRTLAVIESGLNPLITSKMGARGIWQFMPATGVQYGLEINSLVDERCDPRLATQAACKYLKQMYDVYGDWTLAIASYNTGPGNVNKAIARVGGDYRNYKGSFWDVYEYLHEETRQYVPLYMGATYAFAYHRAHGVEVPMPPMPIATDTIMVSRPLHLGQVSSTIGIDHEVLKMLNPQYLMEIIPATTKKYALTLPVENISEYIAYEADIHAKDSVYLKEFVVHANLEKQRKDVPQTQAPKQTTKYHTVAQGETLGSIARKYGVTVKQLVEWNKISNPNALSLGQKLKVTVTGNSKSSSGKSATKYHTVKSGDTLGAIARKYGVTVKQIVQWNKLSNPDALKLGQSLRVSAK